MRKRKKLYENPVIRGLKSMMRQSSKLLQHNLENQLTGKLQRIQYKGNQTLRRTMHLSYSDKYCAELC